MFDGIEELIQYMNARIISTTLDDDVIDSYPRYNIDNLGGNSSAQVNKEFILELENDTEDVNSQFIYLFSYLIEFPNNRIAYDDVFEIPAWDFYIYPKYSFSIRELINSLNGDYVDGLQPKALSNYETKFCIINNPPK